MSEDKNLVAYCGLYCGDCFLHKGEIADLARDLRKKLREAKFTQISNEMSKFANEFKNLNWYGNVSEKISDRFKV